MSDTENDVETTPAKHRLDEIGAAIKVLEAEQQQLYKQSLDAPEEDKLCADWMAEMCARPRNHIPHG